MFGSVREAWETGKAHEESWWLDHLRATIKESNDFLPRCRGETAFQFEQYITPGVDAPRVLDVGAGPVTQVGLRHPNLRIDLTAVDPLANAYNAILKDMGVEPVVRTQVGEAEQLDQLFEAETFDFAFCRNAMDHSYHPLEGIWQTIRTLKPGASFHLCGYVDEGTKAKYVGLHQWNFDVRDRRAVLWRPGINIDLAESLQDYAEIVSASKNQGWYAIILRRRIPARTNSQ